MAPRLSILVPTRDRLELLEASLASARAQTMDDIEIIVSDDGSLDATREYVRDISAVDSRVRLLTSNPTPGAFENIRHLIEHASASALAILGDDDLLLPTFAEWLVPALNDPSVAVSYCMFEVIAGDGSPRPERTAVLRRYHRYAATPPGRSANGMAAALAGQLWLGSCVYRTEVVRRLGLNLAFGSAADWDLAIRAVRTGATSFVPEVLWQYRDHAATISRATSPRALASAIAVLEAHRAPDPDDERYRIDRLRSLLVMQAWKSVVADRDLSIDSIRRYDAIGGRRFDVRRLLAGTLLRLPPAVRATLHGAFAAGVTRARRLRS